MIFITTEDLRALFRLRTFGNILRDFMLRDENPQRDVALNRVVLVNHNEGRQLHEIPVLNPALMHFIAGGRATPIMVVSDRFEHSAQSSDNLNRVEKLGSDPMQNNRERWSNTTDKMVGLVGCLGDSDNHGASTRPKQYKK